MMLRRSFSILLAAAIASPLAGASDVKTVNTSPSKPAEVKNELPPELQRHPPLTKETRIELIRSMEAEFGFAKHIIPKGDKGLQLTSSGQLFPDDQAISMQV